MRTGACVAMHGNLGLQSAGAESMKVPQPPIPPAPPVPPPDGVVWGTFYPPAPPPPPPPPPPLPFPLGETSGGDGPSGSSGKQGSLLELARQMEEEFFARQRAYEDDRAKESAVAESQPDEHNQERSRGRRLRRGASAQQGSTLDPSNDFNSLLETSSHRSHQKAAAKKLDPADESQDQPRLVANYYNPNLPPWIWVTRPHYGPTGLGIDPSKGPLYANYGWFPPNAAVWSHQAGPLGDGKGGVEEDGKAQKDAEGKPPKPGFVNPMYPPHYWNPYPWGPPPGGPWTQPGPHPFYPPQQAQQG